MGQSVLDLPSLPAPQERVMSAPSVRQPTLSIRLGGVALIGGAVAFMGVFAYLAARFDYPAVLDGPADRVLPALLATGWAGRATWAVYGLLPLIWIPAAVGAYYALRRTHPGATLLALHCAAVSAISMMLGLLRWPSIHWRLAEQYAAADASERRVIAAVFDGLNSYLGNYLGEFLGEFAFSSFFVLTAWALLRSGRANRLVAILGLATGALGWIGMFRNLTSAVAPVAAVNNYLLPLWMIVFGVVLLREPPAASSSRWLVEHSTSGIEGAGRLDPVIP
jgi:hypothetical protein